ncbi:hypothetical protein M153_26330001801, partial [Pseudoloma neurophilia]
MRSRFFLFDIVFSPISDLTFFFIIFYHFSKFIFITFSYIFFSFFKTKYSKKCCNRVDYEM